MKSKKELRYNNSMPNPKTPKEQIIELFTGKTIEEIEDNNRIIEVLLDKDKEEEM